MNWPNIPYEHQTLPRGVLENSRFSNPGPVNDSERSTNGGINQEDDPKNNSFHQYGDPKKFSSFTPTNHTRDSKGMMAQVTMINALSILK